MKKAVFLAFLLFCGAAQAKIEVIDGDSLMVEGRNTRLEGIDAPEYDQTCYDAKGALYDCGQRAKEKLTELIKDGISCKRQKIDKYKRDISFCMSDAVNINQQMVASGWAVAYTRYVKDFAPDEKQAKAQKLGIWQGRFMKPELYRALKREHEKGRLAGN